MKPNDKIFITLLLSYAFRHFSSGDIDAVRNWRFEGSLDDSKWLVIYEHRHDTLLDEVSQIHTWGIEVEG